MCLAVDRWIVKDRTVDVGDVREGHFELCLGSFSVAFASLLPLVFGLVVSEGKEGPASVVVVCRWWCRGEMSDLEVLSCKISVLVEEAAEACIGEFRESLDRIFGRFSLQALFELVLVLVLVVLYASHSWAASRST